MKKIRSKKSVCPKLIAEAAAMREAGFTLATISCELNISPRTLCRHFKEMKVSKGSARQALVKRAGERLLLGLGGEERLQKEVAASIQDDLALARLIRETATLILDGLSTETHGDATESARAIAAVSTAVKTTQETVHKSLGREHFAEQPDDDLPVLIIKEMSAADIDAVRNSQRSAPEDF